MTLKIILRFLNPFTLRPVRTEQINRTICRLLATNALNVNIPSMIARTLNCSIQYATVVYTNNQGVFEKDKEEKLTTLKYLKENGMCSYGILDNLELLNFTKRDFEERLPILQKTSLTNDSKAVLKLMQISSKDFSRLQKLLCNCDQIQILSDMLNCSFGETITLLLKYRFLLRSKISTAVEKIDLVKKHGFCTENLKNDLWIITYTAAKLEERIQCIEQLNLFPLKTWMLRCSTEVLLRAGNLRKENQQAIAPSKNSLTYLRKRLNMSQSQLQNFTLRHPPVARVHVHKMKAMIDFLYSEGFTDTQIYSTPKIFSHSISTIQSRVQLLKEKNYKPYSLSSLCKSSKNFDELLRNIELKFMK